MLRSVVSTVMWVGRATVFLIGSAALAGNGDPFKLGRKNTASNISRLVKSGVGPALQLEVGSGPPLGVNSSEKVTNLNADQVDGKDVTAIGINGLQRVESESAENSVSSKQATATCPSGKVLVGTGFDIFGGKSGVSPDQETDVMMDFVIPGSTSVTAAAYEDEATDADWHVKAIAICATAPQRAAGASPCSPRAERLPR